MVAIARDPGFFLVARVSLFEPGILGGCASSLYYPVPYCYPEPT